IKQGDIVAVVGSFDPFDLPDGTKTPNQTHVLIHKVRVTNVQVESSPGAATPEPESDGENEDTAATPEGRLLVTVALSAPNVERVTFIAEFGHLWLAAEPKDADETGTKVVVLDNIWS
ncbi:MAG TPA: hypothetical protein VMQ81_06740, partial [Acidimicrobiia bacterium]|nr:hypothetical protein [Acidimicrobiia bacterium]